MASAISTLAKNFFDCVGFLMAISSLSPQRIGHEHFADCAEYGKGLLSQNCLFGGDSVELCREYSARFQKQLSMVPA